MFVFKTFPLIQWRRFGIQFSCWLHCFTEWAVYFLLQLSVKNILLLRPNRNCALITWILIM